MRRPARRQAVYLIQCNGDDGPVKVGIAVDPNRRLSELRIGCPYPMALLGVLEVDDAEAVERRLHNELRKHRIHGEWFKWCPAVVELVRTARDQSKAVSRSVFAMMVPR